MSLTPLKVLLVEDSPTDRLLVQNSLSADSLAKFDLTIANRLAEGLHELAGQRFDAVLLDLGLPDSQGLDTFQRLHDLYPEVPVVVLSGLADEEVAIQTVQNGAQDYIVKSVASLAALARSLRYAVERQQAQTRLRESEDKFRSVVEYSPDTIFTVDRQMHIQFINRVPAGLTVENALGTSALAYVPPEYRPTVESTIRQVFETGQPASYEIKARGPHDTLAWYSTRLALLKREMQEPQVLLITENITRRKQAEEALQQSEEKYTTLFHKLVTPAALGELSTGVFVDVNEAFERFSGYSRQEIIGKTGFEMGLITPEARAFIKTELLQQGSLREHEAYFQPKTSEKRVALVNISIVELGGQKHVLNTMQDITERKRMETQLRQWADAFEHCAHGMAIGLPATQQILTCNPAFARLQGRTIAEISGMPILSTYTPEDHNLVKQAIATADRTGSVRFEAHRIRADGSVYPVQMDVVSVRDEAGNLLYHVATQQDITERKAAEEARAKLEAQLRHSQRMESIGRLAGGMAHDFNNLLTVIIGYTDLILAQLAPTDPLGEKLEQVLHASEQAETLTRQLLAFSRKQMLAPVVLDLNELITSLHKMLGRLISEDITLTTILQPGLWPIRADPGQLEQVIMNLTVNARDAMPTGGTLTIETVNIQLEGVDTPGVLLVVTDTGHGMDEAILPHIFEPFFTTKEQGKGTGLGLATVYGIVKQSGGEITVESQPGQGTTFKIYLPAHDAPVARPSLPRSQQPDRRGYETILLVEDNPLVRNLVRVALRHYGYTLLEAEQGYRALTLADEHQEPIDLLLTDVIMPEMSGREVAERLKARCPQIKVLFMSGYTDDEVIKHGLLTAEVEFISKPFSPKNLAAKVREILDRTP